MARPRARCGVGLWRTPEDSAYSTLLTTKHVSGMISASMAYTYGLASLLCRAGRLDKTSGPYCLAPRSRTNP
jgi:hypothetical protein